MTTEYDLRQVRRIQDQLLAFRAGHCSLAHFIGESEFLLAAIKNICSEWKAGIDSEIGVLEEVYADALDRGLPELDGRSQDWSKNQLP